MGFWRDTSVVARLLRSSFARPKLAVLNAGGAALLSAAAALEAARAGEWTRLANAGFDMPRTEPGRDRSAELVPDRSIELVPDRSTELVRDRSAELVRDRSIELEARAFWLNLYNALTLHALHAARIEQTVLERAGFFGAFAYRVAGLDFSLNDIEHGVLRGNRATLLSRAPFGRDDPRANLVLPLDPRIHFALNCGALSCPPIRFYEATKLEGQLELAAQSYFQSARQVAGTVWLPRLLSYYRADFGDPLEFARRYRRDLPATARVRFDPYDWGLGASALEDR